MMYFHISEYVGDNSMKLVLLLDYDGTLAPLASHPDVAHLPGETKQVLVYKLMLSR